MEQEIKEIQINGITYVPKLTREVIEKYKDKIVDALVDENVFTEDYAIQFVKGKGLPESTPDELEGLKYAIVRSRDQGVVSGYVVDITGRQVTLKRARQIWRYDSNFVLQDIAEKGVRNPENCKFSIEMSQDMVMLEACGVLYCTEKGGKSIRDVKEVSN